jgi:hypothetical protein
MRKHMVRSPFQADWKYVSKSSDFCLRPILMQLAHCLAHSGSLFWGATILRFVCGDSEFNCCKQ